MFCLSMNSIWNMISFHIIDHMYISRYILFTYLESDFDIFTTISSGTRQIVEKSFANISKIFNFNYKYDIF